MSMITPTLLPSWLPGSVDHLLELLHRESSDSLAGWLRFEDARLFGEGVHTLTGWSCRLLLELHVQGPGKLEGAILLQLICSYAHDTLDDGPNVLSLQSSGFGDRAISLGRSHYASRLHGFHGFHGFHGGHSS